MTARLSDVQGELSEKQKRSLEKSEFTIREQTKELNETRLKLSKLSDIVDKQSTQIESLQSDLSYVIFFLRYNKTFFFILVNRKHYQININY
jgi:hypothetical protein